MLQIQECQEDFWELCLRLAYVPRGLLLAKNELAKNEKETLCHRQCATGMANIT
jgi:hypothetical protein